MVVGLEVGAVQSSPLYKETMAWVRTQSVVSDILSLLETESDFNIEKDLHSLVMVSPEIPTGVDDLSTLPFTIALSGKFDQDAITKAAKTKFPDFVERKEAKLTILGADKRELGFIDGNTLVVASGSKSYLSNTWKKLASQKTTHNAKFKPILSDVVAEHGGWILIDSKSMATGATKGPKANLSALAFRMSDKLFLTMLSHLQDESAATQAVQETEKLKAEAQSNPMITMMGLGPLLKNMAVKQDKSKLWITSSMTELETRTLLTRMRAIAERSQALQTKPALPRKADTAPSQSSTPTSNSGAKKGAAADFN